MIHRDSVTAQCVLSFRAPRLFSLAKTEAKRPPRFRSDSNAVLDSSRNEWSQTKAFITRCRGAPASFDHQISPCKKRGRQCQSDCPRCLEVNGKLERCGLLHRDI